jgi:hypothetical protein
MDHDKVIDVRRDSSSAPPSEPARCGKDSSHFLLEKAHNISEVVEIFASQKTTGAWINFSKKQSMEIL